MTAGTANSKDWKVPTFAERPSNGHFWEGMAGVEGLEPPTPGFGETGYYYQPPPTTYHLWPSQPSVLVAFEPLYGIGYNLK